MEVLTDRPEDRFVAGHVLHREGSDAPLTIVEATAVDDGPGWRLRFREVPDRAAAEPLREAYLEAVVDRTADLAPGAAYWHEVIGTPVRGLDGQDLGKVTDIYRVGEAEVFVVQDGPPGTFDLPVVRDIVRVFAPERGEIVVDASILDLDGAPVDEPRPRPARKRPRWSRHGKGAPAAAASPVGLVADSPEAGMPDAAQAAEAPASNPDSDVPEPAEGA